MVKPRNRDESKEPAPKPAKKKGRKKAANPKTAYVTVRLTEDVLDWLEKEAVADRRPKTQMAAILIEEALEARQAKQ